MSGDRPHMPESDFKSAPLSMTPPGLEDEEMDFPDQLNKNASITNEGAGKLTGLLNYLSEFNDTISINDGRGRRVRVLGIEDVAGGEIAPITEWWGLEVETIDGEIIVTVGEGMCIRPVRFDKTRATPMPHAWGHITDRDRASEESGVSGQEFKISETTKFYVKAYCDPIERELTSQIKSTNLNFHGFNIITSTEDAQPEDTAYEKYQLLGELVIPEEEGEGEGGGEGEGEGGEEGGGGGGHCPEIDMEVSYWRTNHVFNWTYYTFIHATEGTEGKHLNLTCSDHEYSVLNYDGKDGKMGGGANIMSLYQEGTNPVTHYWRFGIYLGTKDPKDEEGIKDANGNILLGADGKPIKPILEEADNWTDANAGGGGDYDTKTNIETISLSVCVSGTPVIKKFVVMK